MLGHTQVLPDSAALCSPRQKQPTWPSVDEGEKGGPSVEGRGPHPRRSDAQVHVTEQDLRSHRTWNHCHSSTQRGKAIETETA